MKQYLLLLKSSDFNKSGNIWTTDPLNVYINSQYKNYSYVRSQYGLNLIKDRTYTGYNVTSPSFYGSHATPFGERSVYVTDAGEVETDSATPSIFRFIDTSSRVDILNYRHTFTNVTGLANPSFNIEILESDTIDGPWLNTPLSGEFGTIFIKNCKPFIKVELEINSDGLDINSLGLVFYLEIGIHEITSPIISDHTRNILRRFPTWTALYADSEEYATPSLATPSSVGGKFLTALTQNTLDDIETEIDLLSINSYINSADENMLAWVYISYNVPPNLVNLKGDNVTLSAVGTLRELFDLKSTDYAYYYNPIDRQLITTRYFQSLLINDILYSQNALNIFNDFDEFGARVGLPRLNLESNSSYKKRILDVNNNLPGVSLDAFKRTLRRELDIWSAYGTTPNSDDTGYLPEVIEISDMENSTPYFSYDNHPQEKFKTLVENLNLRFPSNLGYVNWDEGVWDYSGSKGEGIGRIAALYDVATPVTPEYYQPGVGDFDDVRFQYKSNNINNLDFSGYAEINGIKKIENAEAHSPIVVDYSWYLSYVRKISDYEQNKSNVGLVYEITVPNYNQSTTPSVFYSNLNSSNRNDFIVSNYYKNNSSASPEFNYITIFNQDGSTTDTITFRSKINDDLYYQTSSTPYSKSISAYEASQISVVIGKQWNQSSQSYTNVSASDYRIRFSKADNWYLINPSSGEQMTMSSPNIVHSDANLIIGSTLYNEKNEVQYSNTLNNTFTLNNLNDYSENGLAPVKIYLQDLLSNIAIDAAATPQYLYINVSEPQNITNYTAPIPGGLSKNPETQVDHLIPSSPNIIWGKYNSSDVLIGSEDYFDHATISYGSLPEYIRVHSATVNSYPLLYNYYEPFTATTTPSLFSGYIDVLENTYEYEEEVVNTFYNKDKFLKNINISGNSFNLASIQSPEHVIYNLSLISSTPNVNVYYSNADVINELNSALQSSLSQEVELPIYAEKIDKNRSSSVHAGWLYLDQNEYYIYSDPVVDNFNGRFFELPLTQVPRSGSPILVNIGDDEYRNIAFEDSATPGKMSFINHEIVYGNANNSLYLAYENLSDISVKDQYNGSILFSDLSTESNVISPFDSSTPSIVDREYEVSYKVEKSFYVDKDYYDHLLDSYSAILYLSSTPSTNQQYYITYESSYLNKEKDIDIKIHSNYNPIDEGYIYASKQEYDFDIANIYLSPSYISDNQDDLMNISIIAYDKNGNLKPNQTFKVFGESITANPQYVTTNDNGLAFSEIRYSGDIPAVSASGLINIQGIGSATPYGNENSQTQNYFVSKQYDIFTNVTFNLEVKAVPRSFNVDSDGLTKVVVVGQVYWKNRPLHYPVQLSWVKGRTLYDIFNLNENNTFYADDYGNFTLSEEIFEENSATPGIWLLKIYISDELSVTNYLESIGEVLSNSDVTISGDIVYWNELYDNIHYSKEVALAPSHFVQNIQSNSSYISTPNFVYDHYSSSTIMKYNATPNINLPVWVPLRKFDQYQAGLLGSTPSIVDVYENTHPDNGDQ